MWTFILLALIVGYILYVVIRTKKRIKKDGACGACCSCSHKNNCSSRKSS